MKARRQALLTECTINYRFVNAVEISNVKACTGCRGLSIQPGQENTKMGKKLNGKAVAAFVQKAQGPASVQKSPRATSAPKAQRVREVLDDTR